LDEEPPVVEKESFIDEIQPTLYWDEGPQILNFKF
jgi:hypothetical protein